MSAYDIMQNIAEVAGVKWYYDDSIPESFVCMWDPADYARLYLDKLYIGIIYGKDNIKFLKDKLHCK